MKKKKLGMGVFVSIMIGMIMIPGSVKADEIQTSRSADVKAMATIAEQSVNVKPQIDTIEIQSGSVEHEGDYSYYVAEDGTVDIVKYSGAAETVIIPSTLGGGAVVSIYNEAFYANQSLKNVTIPEGVTSIGYSAFSNCIKLTNVNLPTTLEIIGDNAFNTCESLSALNLPVNLKKIGEYAFMYCASLSSISIPDGVTRIESGTFSDCSSLISADLPEGIENIGSSAFNHCKNLTQITIPASVKSIGQFAFYYCESLGGLVISDSVSGAIIDSDAFTGCKSLTSINIPGGITNIGEAAFNACTGLISINLHEGLSDIGRRAFENCSSLTNVIIPIGIKGINSSTFSGCTSLNSVVLPAGLTKIDDYAFYNCGSLTMINIPEGITNIGSYAFGDCTNLPSIAIPNGCTSLGEWAFSDCDKLASVKIPESVISIGDLAFVYSPLVTIYGISGSYAETYADANNIPFNTNTIKLSVDSFVADQPSGQVVNTDINLSAEGIAGASPYQYKFYYQLGNDMSIIQDFSPANTVIFKPMTAGEYTLSVDVKDADGNIATKSIQMQIISDGVTESAFVAFLGKDPQGNYYEYNALDLNNAYLAYQIKPSLVTAKMYQQFLSSQCSVVALKDQSKGYMDYSAAATASLMAQMKGESFDINAYFARENAKLFKDTIDHVIVIDKDGNAF